MLTLFLVIAALIFTEFFHCPCNIFPPLLTFSISSVSIRVRHVYHVVLVIVSGPLAVTNANLVLGRLLAEYSPKPSSARAISFHLFLPCYICRLPARVRHVYHVVFIVVGGPLAVTDANLVLGRLLPEYFPKIFGKNENEPLDKAASKQAFAKLLIEVGALQKV